MDIGTFRELTPEQKEQVGHYIAEHSANSYATIWRIINKINKLGIGALSPNNMVGFILLLDDVPDEIISNTTHNEQNTTNQ